MRQVPRLPIPWLAVGLFGALASALAGELLVRLAVGPPARFLYGRSFRDRQSDFDITYSVDGEGRRITCGAGLETARERRIAVLGDSFAFGQGVEDCLDLVSQLAARSPRVAFENFGRIGAGIDDYLLVARDLVRGFDGAIVVFFGNDVSDLAAEQGLAGRLAGRLSTLALLRRAKNSFLVDRALRAAAAGSGGDGKIAFLDGRANNILSSLQSDPDAFRRMVQPGDLAVERFRARFSALASRLDERVGAGNVIVAVAPESHVVSRRLMRFIREHGGSVAPFGERGPAYELIRELAEGQGFRFVDVFPAFLADGDALYHPHDLHWSAAGHERMADLLADALRSASERAPSNPG
jgi:hypothetical protein